MINFSHHNLWLLTCLALCSCKNSSQLGRSVSLTEGARSNSSANEFLTTCPPQAREASFCFTSQDGLAVLPVFTKATNSSSDSTSTKTDKPALIVVNGGPGSDSSAYREMAFFKGLGDRFAVYFYDQRETGASDFEGDRSTLSHSENVMDLERLRRVLEDRHARVFALGHSYGAFVVQTHAVRHPGKFKKISLVNGIPQVKVIVLQVPAALEVLYHLAAKFSKSPYEQTALVRGVLYRNLKDSAGRTVDLKSYMSHFRTNQTKKGLTETLPQWAKSLYQSNRDYISFVAQEQLSLNDLGKKVLTDAEAKQTGQSLSLAENPGAKPFSFGFAEVGGLHQARPSSSLASKREPKETPSDNAIVDCNSFTTRQNLNGLESSLSRSSKNRSFLIDMARTRFLELCNSLSQDLDNFDLRRGREKIQSAVLLVASLHDLLFPFKLVNSYWQEMKKLGVPATLLKAANSGHTVFVGPEQACVRDALHDFFYKTPSKSESLTCDKGGL